MSLEEEQRTRANGANPRARERSSSAAVFELADRISVLVYGKVLVSGSVAQIRGNAQVQAVYVGTEDISVTAMGETA